MSKKIKMHAADHLLAVALKKKFPGIRPKAFQLGEEKTRAIYESDQKLSKNDIPILEKEVNEYIAMNLEVEDEMLSRKEAEKICDISLIPESVQKVRVVNIGSVSQEACIGEHVNNTAEMGTFKILELKKIGKNTYKIYFTIIE